MVVTRGAGKTILTVRGPETKATPLDEIIPNWGLSCWPGIVVDADAVWGLVVAPCTQPPVWDGLLHADLAIGER